MARHLQRARGVGLGQGGAGPRVGDVGLVQGLETLLEALGSEVQGVVVGLAHQVDARARQLPAEVTGCAEVVEGALEVGPVVEGELHVPVGQVRLLQDAKEARPLGIRALPSAGP